MLQYLGLKFPIKALFSSYSVISLAWMLLRAAGDSFDDNFEAAHGRYVLKLIRTTAAVDKVSRSDR